MILFRIILNNKTYPIQNQPDALDGSVLAIISTGLPP